MVSRRGMTPEVAAAAPALIDVLRLSTTYLGDHGSTSSRLDSELLCAHALGLRRIDLYLQFDRPLDEAELTSVRELVRRRGKGEPVAYITGTREFYGRPFHVTSDVLVPRPDTETLVQQAVAFLRDRPGAELRVADLGTGSGCIAITLAAEVTAVRAVGTDVSTAALDVARENAESLGVDVSFVECSWADCIEGGYDLIVSNPPYVTTQEFETVERDVRDFEPRDALLGGDDGLDAYRPLLVSVRDHAIAARVMLEVDPRHAEAVTALVSATFPGATTVPVPDLTGRTRVLDVAIA
ncbi:MAG: peptide chain release factor N(5)-glutamine methyltransferase [Candidatus Dormiibacterota bacterium]